MSRRALGRLAHVRRRLLRLALQPSHAITSGNVRNVVPKWVYHVPAPADYAVLDCVPGRSVLTNTNSVYAIDARSGRLGGSMPTREPRRAASIEARLYGATRYTSPPAIILVALDRHTGGLIFNKNSRTSTRDHLDIGAAHRQRPGIVGSAGGDSGMRGFIMALSADTGEQLGRRTPAGEGRKGIGNLGRSYRLGGAPPALRHLRPDLNTLYWTTGNPWPDYNAAVRKVTILHLLAALTRPRHRQDEVVLPIHSE